MNDILLMSVHPDFYLNQDTCKKIYETRRQFFKTEGIDLKYVRPDEFDLLEGTTQEGFRIEQAKNWIRDVFQIINGKLLVSPSHQILKTNLEKKLGMDSKISNWGEGGLFIPTSKGYLTAPIDSLTRDANFFKKNKLILPIHMPTENDVRKKKYSEEFLERIKNYHISNELAHIFSKKGNSTFCISEEYRTFLGQDYLKKLCKVHDASLFTSSESHNLQPQNIPKMPDGRYILSKKCTETIKYLTKVIGKNQLLIIETLPGEVNLDGGLQCRTNVIPKEFRKNKSL